MTFVTARNSIGTALRLSTPGRWLARIDPRNSLGAATGWLIAAVSLGLALAASAWVSAVASSNLLELKSKQLTQYAERLSSQLDITLYAHLQSVRATAAMLASANNSSPEQQRQFLHELQGALPEYTWAGYADVSGRMQSATEASRERESAADEAWFRNGSNAPWISDVQNDPRAGASRRYILMSAPAVDAQGRRTGVVGVRLSGSWAEELKRKLDRATHPKGWVETFIVDRNDRVLFGPEVAVGKSWSAIADEAGYIEAGSRASEFAGAPGFAGLGWAVWVREAKVHALARVAQLRFEIFAILFGLGLLAAVAGAYGAGRLLRRIGLVAELADTVRSGHARKRLSLQGRDEAARIGHTLTELVSELEREKAELQALNAELDARVAARTREVERLSEENKYAAVIRERLRIARDLHDTLAHSMMAMLTQIRLLRKFADSNPQLLREELERAEEAAQSGLNEARAAIGQMRYNAVRDTGLGAALSALVQRFEQRTGIDVDYRSDARAAQLADARAETLFRMLEELLHNTERHAYARRMRVELHYFADSATLIVEVADDGVGFDPSASAPGHYGLRGLREQAALIGGALAIESGLQRGTCTTITVPLWS